MLQALAQCENTLTKLGLVREAVDDTAGAAKVFNDNIFLLNSEKLSFIRNCIQLYSVLNSSFFRMCSMLLFINLMMLGQLLALLQLRSMVWIFLLRTFRFVHEACRYFYWHKQFLDLKHSFICPLCLSRTIQIMLLDSLCWLGSL